MKATRAVTAISLDGGPPSDLVDSLSHWLFVLATLSHGPLPPGTNRLLEEPGDRWNLELCCRTIRCHRVTTPTLAGARNLGIWGHDHVTLRDAPP